jgi:hypothetical protein
MSITPGIYAIESACFSNTFLHMNAASIDPNSPDNGVEAGIVNSQTGHDERGVFSVQKTTYNKGGKDVECYTIQSTFQSASEKVPQAYLSIDASDKTGMSPTKPDLCGGIVGCRATAGGWEKFFIEELPGQPGIYTIGSIQFGGVYLRMGDESSQASPHGGGIVNCRYNHYPWEHFRFVPVSPS